eukprot:g1014.t1
MTRQSPNICNLAIFFLVLLLNHETITVANRITESIKTRQQLKGNTFANNIISMIKKIEADGDDFTSFLEVKDMQGMSAEQYATHEIKEMHKSLKEGFSFKNSPILEELKELNNIPESQKVLSLDQLKKHRYEISILLEKAMSSVTYGALKGVVKASTKVGAKTAKRTKNYVSAGGTASNFRGDHGVSWVRAKGPMCKKTTDGVCIDIHKNRCNEPTLRGECLGAANIRCCPTGLIVVSAKPKEFKLSGTCERKMTFGTCSKNSECKPDKQDPCNGECMCDDRGLNTCACVKPGTIEKLEINEELDKLDTGKIFIDNEKFIEDAIPLHGFNIKPLILFGFIDGFLGGMATDMKKGWSDSKCHDSTPHMKHKFQNLLRKTKIFWQSVKSLPKDVWSTVGRRTLIRALKGLLAGLVNVIKSVWKFATNCPATKMIGTILFVIIGVVLLNLAFIAAGWLVLPLLVKIVGGIVGLYYSFKYIKNTVIAIYKEIRYKVVKRRCHNTCKRTLVEKTSALMGAVFEVILLGGLGDFGKIIKTSSAKNLFKRYKIEMSPKLVSDIGTLKKSADVAIDGGKTSIKNIASKFGKRL